MRILQINKFFYLKGGPERYMFSVSELLKSRGHEVAFFSMQHENNQDCQWSKYFIEKIDYNKKHNCIDKIKIFKNTLYSHETEIKLLQLITDFKPDIAHIHNFNHQLTPSILFALKKKNVPIVMTLHDYKLVCPSYSMLNHCKVCELCKGRKFYRCAITRCHKDSFSKSFLATLESYLHHQVLNSYKFISCFICPSKFIMNKIQEMGLKGNFVHLPNFVDVNSLKPAETHKSNKFVYWGRLSPEKGIYTMIEAMKGISAELEVIGEGPLEAGIRQKVKEGSAGNIRLSGYLSGSALFDRIKESFAAIIPSECYENNPMSILESFALGIPVIGARIGGITELVEDGNTGLLFNMGDPDDLCRKIKWLLDNPEENARMSTNVRKKAEEVYYPNLHYQSLIKVYNDVLESI